MATRLSDSELANRTREANRRRGERHRQRLAIAGKSALTVWIDAGLKAALTAAAAANGATLADTAAQWLMTAALNDPTGTEKNLPATSLPPVDTLPLFDAPAGPVEDAQTPVDRDSRILALKREQPQLSNYAIAAQVGCSEATARRVVNRAKQEATV